jgi:mannosyltransferase
MTSVDGARAGRHAADTGSRTKAQPVAAQPAGDEQQGFWTGPLWMLVVPPLAALGMTLWGITGSSYIPDEAATISATQRSIPQLLRMLSNIDAVHGPYYLFMWFVVRLGGTGELATRLPSALATVIATVGVVAIGGRLVSHRAGLAAGLVFATLPMVGFFGQDARPYAIMTAFGVFASYALIRVLEAEPGHRQRWFVMYAVCMAGLSLAQVFALPFFAAHAVTIALRCRPGSGEKDRRSLILGWLASAVAAVVVCTPILYLGFKQRGSLNTLTYTPFMKTWPQMFHSQHLQTAVLIVFACAIVASVLTGRWRALWRGKFLALCLPWLILPTVILEAASVVTPVYAERFVAYSLPALALLVGVALDALGWIAGVAALTAIVVAGIPESVHQRTATGHGSNIRLADQIIAADKRPGDVVLYGALVTQYQRFAYPYGSAQLRDIDQLQTPARNGTLTGSTVGTPKLRLRLVGIPRVWLFGGGPRQAALAGSILIQQGFKLIHIYDAEGISLMLYADSHNPPATHRG